MPMRSIFAVCLTMILGVSPGISAAQAAFNLSAKAQDGLLHVVAHEIGHAFLREFDLPILGPEEDIADDFATVYIHLMLPDKAPEIISARALQNMADGSASEMFSEYRSDDQRAGRSVCILYGLDPDRYETLAQSFGLEGDDARGCRNSAPEIGRSWRRVLSDYLMPDHARVTEVGISVSEDSAAARSFAESGALETAYDLLAEIDWHSRITLKIASCDGSSSWSRNSRRITICDTYIRRFQDQLGR